MGRIVKENKPISFEVPSGAIFDMPEVQQMMRDNRKPKKESLGDSFKRLRRQFVDDHVYSFEDAESATQRPTEAFLNPQYEGGEGTEIVLFPQALANGEA